MQTNMVFPEYLESFDLLQQHIRAQLEGLNTTKKGNRFAHFVQRLIPQSDAASGFETPELSETISGDRGIDLIAQGRNLDKVLFVQSKLWVDRADKIDSVISKFQAFIRMDTDQQPLLFDLDEGTKHFMLVTLSPISGILNSYGRQDYSSKAFYQQCIDENRLHFIDGLEILALLRTAYRKLNQLPNELTINFETPYVQKRDVYIGVISSIELKKLHKQAGDALFFENIRDFLGVKTRVEKGRTTPNLEIIKTIQDAPDKMLSRNNGLVFGAHKVTPGETDRQLILNGGSVVNGCQTTMCLVEYSDTPCYVLAKVVQTQDAWDITKSANYQTSVPDIDLELARYLRPQLVKRAAMNLGVQIKDAEKSAFQLIDVIYDRKIAYSETRLLYIGLFSRTPNNVFAANYTELMQDLIRGIYEDGLEEESVFEVLFLLQGAAQESLSESQMIFDHPSYARMFERLYKDDSRSYRCLLGILTLCGAVNIDISDRKPDLVDEQERTKDFLKQARSILVNDKERFGRFHKLAIKLWMQDMLTDEDDAKVRRDMYVSSKGLNFTNLFRKLCMEADLDPFLRPEKSNA